MDRIKRKLTDLKENKDKLATIGQFGFFAYYAIMVITKAFGYVSYEMFFKVSFALS